MTKDRLGRSRPVFLSDWARALVIVKPATVIVWHRSGFRALWRRKC